MADTSSNKTSKPDFGIRLLKQIQEARKEYESAEKTGKLDLLSEDFRKRQEELDKKEEEVRKAAEEGASRTTWFQLADTVGRSLAALGAAREGLKSGVDLSKAVDMRSPIDWEARRKGVLDRGDVEQGQIDRKRSQELGAYKEQAGNIAGERDKYFRAIEEAAKLSAQEEGGGAGVDKYQQTGYETAEGDPLVFRGGKWFRRDGTEYPPDQPIRQRPAGIERGAVPGVGTGVTVGEQPITPKEAAQIDKARASFETETKEARNSMGDYAVARDMLGRAEQGNASALQFMGSFLARAIQGGRLTDKDVVMYVQRPDIAGKIENAQARLLEGRLPEESAQQIREVIDGIEQIEAGKLKIRAAEKARPIQALLNSRGLAIEADAIVPLIYQAPVAAAAKAPAAPTEKPAAGTLSPEKEARLRELLQKRGR